MERGEKRQPFERNLEEREKDGREEKQKLLVFSFVPKLPWQEKGRLVRLFHTLEGIFFPSLSLLLSLLSRTHVFIVERRRRNQVFEEEEKNPRRRRRRRKEQRSSLHEEEKLVFSGLEGFLVSASLSSLLHSAYAPLLQRGSFEKRTAFPSRFPSSSFPSFPSFPSFSLFLPLSPSFSLFLPLSLFPSVSLFLFYFLVSFCGFLIFHEKYGK